MKDHNILKNDFPRVSIVIPVYNGADYLSAAICSAIDQTYENIEIIVVNDGSNDNGETERIAQSFGTAIRYFVKKNGGVASALNLAIREMTGDYFSWLSHDDLYCKEKIAFQVKALAKNGLEKVILYSDYSIFTNNAENAIRVRMNGVQPEHFRYWITTQSALHGCTLLIPRSFLQEYRGFNEELRNTQDYALWFRMAEKYNFIHIPEVLVKARSHPNQGSMNITEDWCEEINDLYMGFVRSLKGDEIPLAKGQPLGAGYLAIAKSLWHRGFMKAANCACLLASQYGINRFCIYRAKSLAYIQKNIIEILRHMLKPRARLILRNALGRIVNFKQDQF